MPHKTIALEELKDIPSLPRGSHIALLQKCTVAFDSQGFCSGLILLVECQETLADNQVSLKEAFVKLIWQDPVDEVLRLSHADLNESVEDSAKALAMLLISTLTPYKIGRQSPRGSHIDYYLVDADAELPFQVPDTAGLEFTGILSGIDEVRGRIKQKRDRLHKVRDFPTYIVCVEHSFPLARIERVEP